MSSGFDFLKNAAVLFVLFGSFLYLGLYFFYEFIIIPKTNLEDIIIDNLVQLTEGALKLLGYELIQYPDELFKNRVGIAGSSGVYIGEPCNGFVLFILFLSFITAFPGSINHKLWFIPIGIILIHFINFLRVCALVLILRSHPDWLSFNHDYTFTIVVYSFVFLLWWIWINKFASLGKRIPAKK